MTAYILTRTQSEELDTVIFAAGPNDRDEAVAVFTDLANAEQYLVEANWSPEYTVATLESIPFLRWMLQLHDNGVSYLAIDPTFADQQSGVRIDTLSIEGHLEHAGKHIVDVARPDF